MITEERLQVLRALAREWIARAGERPIDATADALAAGRALEEALRAHDDLAHAFCELAQWYCEALHAHSDVLVRLQREIALTEVQSEK